MKLIAPDYYSRFRCIAGACRHTCCAGWEIDIDEKTRAAYRDVPGPLGERLRTAIADEADGAHFRLVEGERCPFLNSEGLCDLICTLGEESLCQVCADHPRFRNFLSDRTEIGLGLCCEAAAQLILGWKPPVCLVTLEDDDEDDELWEDDAEVLAVRDRLIACAQDRRFPIAERTDRICRLMNITEVLSKPLADWPGVYCDLEVLDQAWLLEVSRLAEPCPPLGAAWELPLEQLLVYLLYRHVTGAAEDGDLEGRAAFAVVSWLVVRGVCASRAAEGPFSLADMAEMARMYSSEIEYSDENVQRVIDSALGEA